MKPSRIEDEVHEDRVVSLNPRRADRERRREKPRAEPAAMSEEDVKELERLGLKTFVQEYAHLRRKSMAEDFSGEATSYALLRAQLAATIRALGVMDKAFIQSGGRNAYSYVAVQNLARELAHDLRSHDDQSAMVEKIRGEVVRNLLTTLAGGIVSRLIGVRKRIGARSTSKDARFAAEEIRKVQEEMTRVFSDAEQESIERIHNVLRR